MFLDHREPAFVKLRAGLSVIVAPVQYLVDWPIRLVNWMDSSISTHESLLKENTHLKVEQILLKAQVQKLISLEKENRQLRALLKTSPRDKERMVAAQILSVDSSPFSHQVVLDKGRRDGVYVGQPVLDASGVMGQVIQVGLLTSQVLLLTDTRSAIPVQINGDGTRAIVVGTGALSTLSLVNIPKTTEIVPGQRLLTSGLGERFPAGYPVGVIKSVVQKPGNSFAEIKVQPSAYINRSRMVLLVWLSNRNEGKSTHGKS